MAKEHKKEWNVNGREAHIVKSTSGQFVTFDIKIIWSKKLGLTLKHRFHTSRSYIDEKHYNQTLQKVQKTVELIQRKGKINTEHWVQTYYPTNRFLDGFHD